MYCSTLWHIPEMWYCFCTLQIQIQLNHRGVPLLQCKTEGEKCNCPINLIQVIPSLELGNKCTGFDKAGPAKNLVQPLFKHISSIFGTLSWQTAMQCLFFSLTAHPVQGNGGAGACLSCQRVKGSVHP